MFFSISKSKDFNFPENVVIGSFIVNLDEGWETAHIDNKTVFYKGYTDTVPLATHIPELLVNSVSGNYTLIVAEDDTISIKSSKLRASPIYVSADIVTNLVKQNTAVWNNETVAVDSELRTTITTNPTLKFDLDFDVYRDDVIKKIDSILLDKVEKFLTYNTLPIKVYLSGGVDSMLVYSYIKKLTKNYDLLACQHKDLDYFWCKNSDYIENNYWAYTQINHFTKPTILSVGTPGDEFMLRAPGTSNLWLMHYGKSIPEVMTTDKYKDSAQSRYFMLPKNISMYESHTAPKFRHIVKNKQYLINYLCNNMVNDFQHWHLGNTLTFTPLRDLDIALLMFSLNEEDATDQIFNSAITRDLISLHNPDLLKYISTYKNTNELEHMWDYISQYQ